MPIFLMDGQVIAFVCKAGFAHKNRHMIVLMGFSFFKSLNGMKETLEIHTEQERPFYYLV